MTELTPAQKLRVAAALSEDGVALRLDRKTALALAQSLEAADRALSSMDTMTADHAIRMARMDDISMWSVRVVALMGLVQAVASWWLS